MIKSCVTIYVRNEDGFFIHANAFTSIGLLSAVPPFIHLTIEDIKDEGFLIKSIKNLLYKEQAIIKHVNPDESDEDDLKPLYSLAGCKNWKTFARKCQYLSFMLHTDQKVKIRKCVWDGKGFNGVQSEILEYDEDSSDIIWYNSIMSLLIDK